MTSIERTRQNMITQNSSDGYKSTVVNNTHQTTDNTAGNHKQQEKVQTIKVRTNKKKKASKQKKHPKKKSKVTFQLILTQAASRKKVLGLNRPAKIIFIVLVINAEY